MSYKFALESLLAYEPKRLICVRLFDGRDCCAVGAILPAVRHFGNAAIPLEKEKTYFSELGITQQEAHHIICKNDGFFGTEEQRYEYMVAWLQTQVAMESSNGQSR